MPGTFFGLEIARRGIRVHQHSLDITSHNLANASTPGYSRQEGVLKTTDPYSNPTLESSVTPGQLGTGVAVDIIRRIRDEYLDNGVRQAATATGYWRDQINFLQRAEAAFGEPASDGIAGQVTKFFKAWMTLNNNPQDPGAKAVVVEYGQQLAFMMNTAYGHLADIHESIAEIDTSEGKVVRGALVDQVNKVNELLDTIFKVNESIKRVYELGQQPNDLLDRRDQLLEQLSHYVPVGVTLNTRGGLPGEIMELKVFGYSVTSGDNKFYLGIEQVDINGDDNPETCIVLKYGDSQNPNNPEFRINLTEQRDNTALGGSLLGLEKARQTVMEYQSMLNDIGEQMKKHIAGVLAGTYPPALPDDIDVDKYFFSGSLENKNFNVIEDLVLNPSLLNGERAGEVAGLRDEKIGILNNSTFEEYYGMLISKVGGGVESADGMAGNHELIARHITALRDSVSGVSIDEELTRMIQFQYGFQASARVVSVMDEMLDVIINRLF